MLHTAAERYLRLFFIFWTALKPLKGIVQLEDAPKLDTAQQAQQSLLRFCSNMTIVYFLRTMPPSVTIDAARLHDDLIEEAFHRIVASAAGSASQRARAAKQARLPVKHGGMGLTSMESIRDAAWVGTWALVWKPLRELHEPFRAVDITRESDGEFQQLSIFTELQAAHASLMTRYETVAATYAQYDRQLYDYCKEGLAHYRVSTRMVFRGGRRAAAACGIRFWQRALTKRSASLLPDRASCSVAQLLERAGGHGRAAARGRALHRGEPASRGRRAQRHPHAVRVPGAVVGDARHRAAAPRPAARRVSRARCADVHGARRQGAGPHGRRGLSNIGRAGHNQRHAAVLRRLVQCMQSVWGKLVEMEPQDHLGYSNDYRPDLTARGLGAGGKRLVGDVKFKDPLSSNPEDIKRRGCFVGFGCTEPGTRAAMYGLEQRGEKGDGDFRPGDGGGYVAPKKADYTATCGLAATRTCRCCSSRPSVAGACPWCVCSQQDAGQGAGQVVQEAVYDDEVSWTTRTWSSLMWRSACRWRCTWRRRGRLPVSCRSRVPRTRRPSSVGYLVHIAGGPFSSRSAPTRKDR